jgi:hypothetical protein
MFSGGTSSKIEHDTATIAESSRGRLRPSAL